MIDGAHINSSAQALVNISIPACEWAELANLFASYRGRYLAIQNKIAEATPDDPLVLSDYDMYVLAFYEGFAAAFVAVSEYRLKE